MITLTYLPILRIGQAGTVGYDRQKGRVPMAQQVRRANSETSQCYRGLLESHTSFPRVFTSEIRPAGLSLPLALVSELRSGFELIRMSIHPGSPFALSLHVGHRDLRWIDCHVARGWGRTLLDLDNNANKLAALEHDVFDFAEQLAPLIVDVQIYERGAQERVFVDRDESHLPRSRGCALCERNSGEENGREKQRPCQAHRTTSVATGA